LEIEKKCRWRQARNADGDRQARNADGTEELKGAPRSEQIQETLFSNIQQKILFPMFLTSNRLLELDNGCVDLGMKFRREVLWPRCGDAGATPPVSCSRIFRVVHDDTVTIAP
jgi:hypothetical protein